MSCDSKNNFAYSLGIQAGRYRRTRVAAEPFGLFGSSNVCFPNESHLNSWIHRSDNVENEVRRIGMSYGFSADQNGVLGLMLRIDFDLNLWGGHLFLPQGPLCEHIFWHLSKLDLSHEAIAVMAQNTGRCGGCGWHLPQFRFLDEKKPWFLVLASVRKG